MLFLISNIGFILAGFSLVRFEYASAICNILTSQAPRASGYQYSILFLIHSSHKLCKKGFATSSHHRAINNFTAGMFLLNHKAFFRGIGHSKAQSALWGVSLPALNSIS